MPSTSTPVANTSPQSKCSGKFCRNTLSFGFYKGNVCQQCSMTLRRRDGHGPMPRKDVELDSGVSEIMETVPNACGDPSQVKCTDLGSPSSMRASRVMSIDRRLNQHPRSSFAIPHQSVKLHVIANNQEKDRVSTSISNTSVQPIPIKVELDADLPMTNAPAETSTHLEDTHICNDCKYSGPGHQHGVTCRNCGLDAAAGRIKTACTASMIIPVEVQPLASTSSQPISQNITCNPLDLNDDVDNDMDYNSEDELPFPDYPAATVSTEFPYPPSPPPSAMPQEPLGDSPPDVQQMRHKRPKLTHPNFSPSLPNESDEDNARPIRPTVRKKSNNTSRSFKLCSTEKCTGNVSATSSATRCLNCVKRDWKIRKSRFMSGEEHPAGGVDEDVEMGPLKKKGVTWADETPSALIAETEGSTTPPLDNISSLTTKNLIAVDDAAVNDSDLSQPDILQLKHPSKTKIIIKNGSMMVSTKHTIMDPNTSDGEAQKPHPPTEGRLEFTSSTPVGQHRLRIRPASPVKKSGWDSDLTVSDEEETPSKSEANVQLPPKHSVLTIRIPARPGGVHIRQCGSNGCSQLLDKTYRWKSCVMCRARSRDYQRKRQNIQGRHWRLDEELRAQGIGTPLAGDFKDRHQTHDEDIALVGGARLCSIRNCTYIIPPVDEYRWKMCSLCRLCRKEKNRQDKYNGIDNVDMALNGDDEKQMAPRLIILKALNNLPLRSGPRPPNRCQSADCGMLLESKSPQCKQCTARHLWLVARSGSSGQVPIRSHHYPEKSRKPSPSPYSQYQCFAALLLEFKNHLSGFLRAQSIFYLFKDMEQAKAMFAFDGEFSIVAQDFDLVKRQEGIDEQALKYKREVEHVGRIKFNTRRLIMILEGGGIAVRFVSQYTVPILHASMRDNAPHISRLTKQMQCELEIANLPDYSHPFIPAQRTIIRFRLLG